MILIVFVVEEIPPKLLLHIIILELYLPTVVCDLKPNHKLIIAKTNNNASDYYFKNT